MALTINTKTYDFDRHNSPDSAQYAGPNHTSSNTDIVTLGRTYPKPVKDFDGVSRGSVDVVRHIVGTDGKRRRVSLKLTSSVEVGVTTSEIEACLADVADFIASPGGKAVFTKLDINA